MTIPHDAPWLHDPAVRELMKILNGETPARFVGGCVRDALLGRFGGDIDIATPLRPDTVMARLRRAGVSAIPTGLTHGTVTAVLGGKPFEVTTLRRDVATDGRRAVVAFTDDWRADAARRDFTFNAMSATADGVLYDYFGGADDLRSGRVRFVGDPATRIAEDYLRILRYFRFYAWFGKAAPDAATLEAITAAAPGIAGLSAERIRAELLKLLAAPNPAAAWRLAIETGVAAMLPSGAGHPDLLERLIAIEPAPDPIRRLAALTLGGDLEALGRALRLSRAEARRLATIHAARNAVVEHPDEAMTRALAYRFGGAATEDALVLAEADGFATAKAREALAGWTPPKFPLRGRDAHAVGLTGPAVGAALRAVEEWWISEDFQPDREALLHRLQAWRWESGEDSS